MELNPTTDAKAKPPLAGPTWSGAEGAARHASDATQREGGREHVAAARRGPRWARKTTHHDPCVPSWGQAGAPGGRGGVGIGRARSRRKDTWGRGGLHRRAVVAARPSPPLPRTAHASLSPNATPRC